MHEPMYVLKEYSGKIAVFKYNDAKPLEVFNVSVDTMSDYDKLALRTGISAETERDLWLLVEDYTS